MGIHPKIGITGLPKSGKSAVLEKVVDMITNERKDERRSRNDRSQGMPIIGGMRTEPILEDGVRIGFECVDIITGDRAVWRTGTLTRELRFWVWELTPLD